MSLIVADNSDLKNLLDGWIEAERSGVEFPVPFDGDPMDNFNIALMALTRLKENKNYYDIAHKTAQIQKWRRNVRLPSENHHSILIEMIDAVEVWAFHWGEMASKAEENARKPKGGFVYFLLDIVNLVVKIGWTTNIQERVGTLERSSGSKTHLLGTIHCDSQKSETLMHQRFARDRSNGEWFFLSENLQYLILKRFPEKRKLIQACLGTLLNNDNI